MSDSRQEQWLEARIQDVIRQGEKYPAFTAFLDEREAAIAEKLVQRARCENFRLWGGYENGERVMLGVFPSYQEPDPEEFPITAITVRYRPCDELSHRDFLGAFLGAGVQRSALGDILPEKGRCVLFVREETARFLLEQVDKVGRVGVTLSPGFSEPLPEGREFAAFEGAIASPRLDCAVAAAVGLSREKAAGLVLSGMVMKNHEPVQSVSALVAEGDLLSVRGKGRYRIDRLGPKTKKGRLGIAGRKYL